MTATAPVTITTAPSATISYSGTPFCTSVSTPQTVIRTGTAGGTYTASPATLTIDAVTGAITPSTSTAGTYTVTYTIAAAGGCSAVTATATITVNACFKTLNLTSVMLQGLYNSGGTMKQAMNGGIPKWPAGVADHITVELHSAAVYADIVFAATDVPLSINGTVTISTIPDSFNGSYYITIKHRNHIETTTASVVSFSGGTINYAFDLPSKVFGNNLILMAGPGTHYAIYGGDSNSDGVTDGLDLINVENGATLFSTGYIPIDLNGDGIVDAFDLILAENNAFNFVTVKHP